jgi:hypothetical protein
MKGKTWFLHCFSVAIPRLAKDLVTLKIEPIAKKGDGEMDVM